jgi:Fe-S oxidoreductase
MSWARARRSFRQWFANRSPRSDGERILLWPDSFTNTFHPEVPRAAVDVLEHLGYRVEIPERRLCCGCP